MCVSTVLIVTKMLHSSDERLCRSRWFSNMLIAKGQLCLGCGMCAHALLLCYRHPLPPFCATTPDNWYEDRVQGHEDVPFSERSKVLCEKTADIAFIMTSANDRDRVYEPPLPIPRIRRLENPSSARTMPCYNQYVSRDYKTTAGTSSSFWAAKKQAVRVNRKMITADTIQCAPKPAVGENILPKTEDQSVEHLSASSGMFQTASQMYMDPMLHEKDAVQTAREDAAERQSKERVVGGRPAPKTAEALGRDYFTRRTLL